jgi:hypothetical protein
MSSQVYADRLSRSLSQTGLVEVVEASFADTRISVLFRVKGGVDHKWLEVVHNILLSTEHFRTSPSSWHSHICKTFFLKDIRKQKKLVFGWTLALTSNSIPQALDQVIRVIAGGKPEPSVEAGDAGAEGFEDIPLIGAPRERNAPGSSGKGAFSIGGKTPGFRPPVK